MCMIRTLQMYTPSKFQGYNTYFKLQLYCYTLAFQNLFYKIETLYPLNPWITSLHSLFCQFLPTTDLLFSFMCSSFLDSIYKWDYTIFVCVPLILVLICISLMISDAEHLLMYLFFSCWKVFDYWFNLLIYVSVLVFYCFLI